MSSYLKSIGAKGLRSGLVAYYPMDEASGDPVDRVTGDTLSKVGTTFTYEQQIGTTGVNGVLINGQASDYFTSDLTKYLAGDCAVSFWFDDNGQTSKVNGNQFLSFFDSTSYRQNLHYRSTPTLSSFDGTTTVNYGNPTLYDNAAHNIVWLLSGSNGIMASFVDGAFVGSVEASSPRFLQGISDMQIGKGIEGIYGQLGVYNRLLTLNEIETIYNSGSPIDLITGEAL